MAETATGAVTKATSKATTKATAAAGRTATTVKKTAKKGTAKAAAAVARTEPLHYDVEVNKRGLSVKALTRTLNERWEDGWRLAHLVEQRGNTVLVFEKRSGDGDARR